MEILIDSQLPVITGNFEEIKNKLAESLKSYEISVTDENLAEAKKMATELNKMASEFDRRRKDVEAEITKPVKAFKDQVDQLVQMCKAGREQILTQVQVFEDRKKEELKNILISERGRLCEQAGIPVDFMVSDLAILSNITSTGSLAKAARDAIESRVNQRVAEKNFREARIAKAEAEALKAGIEPFTLAQIEQILKSETFDQQILSMISQEIERQKRIEETARLKAEAAIKAEQAKIESESRAKELAEERSKALAEQKAEADRRTQQLAEKAKAEFEARQSQAQGHPIAESAKPEPRNYRITIGINKITESTEADIESEIKGILLSNGYEVDVLRVRIADDQ